LHAEPLREYEEIKKKADEKPAGGEGRRGKGPKSAEAAAAPAGSESAPIAAKETAAKESPAKESPTETTAPEADEAKATTAAEEKAAMGMGMMDGVPGMGRRGNGPAAVPEVKYDPTAWGRYAKILLSSSEFLFVD
jgi:hypothetical protein